MSPLMAAYVPKLQREREREKRARQKGNVIM